MTAQRVLVVEHQSNAGLGHLRGVLEARGLELVTVGPEVSALVPETLDGFDALIVLGGRTGPVDDERAPWLPATRALLVAGVEQAIPTLGVCLGAQMLVTVAGGNVRVMPEGPELGLNPVAVSAEAMNDPLFGELAGAVLPAMQWHWLEADALPQGASLLASSDACQNQAFRVGPAAWGVQFHPEALGSTAAGWAEEDNAHLVALGIEGAVLVEEVRDAETKLIGIWSTLAERFADVVERAESRLPDHAA